MPSLRLMCPFQKGLCSLVSLLEVLLSSPLVLHYTLSTPEPTYEHVWIISIYTMLFPARREPRTGQVVVFLLPAVGAAAPEHKVGLVLSVWKGVKVPKVISGPCHINCCNAFRAVTMHADGEAGFHQEYQRVL